MTFARRSLNNQSSRHYSCYGRGKVAKGLDPRITRIILAGPKGPDEWAATYSTSLRICSINVYRPIARSACRSAEDPDMVRSCPTLHVNFNRLLAMVQSAHVVKGDRNNIKPY